MNQAQASALTLAHLTTVPTTTVEPQPGRSHNTADGSPSWSVVASALLARSSVDAERKLTIWGSVFCERHLVSINRPPSHRRQAGNFRYLKGYCLPTHPRKLYWYRLPHQNTEKSGYLTYWEASKRAVSSPNNLSLVSFFFGHLSFALTWFAPGRGA